MPLSIHTKKMLQWSSIVLVVVGIVSAYSVQAYQVVENSTDIEEIQTIQVQQAVTETKINYIQKDLENLDDNMEELNDKMDLILQQLNRTIPQ